MASNIKIVGNIINTTQVSRYSEDDLGLISSQRIQEDFGGTNDYIEYYIYDVAENLLNTNYNYLKYKLPTSTGLKPGTTTIPNTTGNIQTENIGIDSTLSIPTSSLYPIIEIDPVQDLQDLGYSSGEFKVRYNLFQTKLSNYIDSALFIKEISQDRTEIRLASTTLTNDEIESTTLSLIDKINNTDYYVSYLLNFGNNKQYIAVNVALNKAPEGYEVLFKLYKQLPLEVQEKQTLWIVEEKVEPYLFDINLDKLITLPPPPTLRGPNFDIPISENQGTISSTYQTYETLVSSVQSLQQNSYHQILNLLATQSIQINVDYTDYNNFVFFGSANQRLANFRDKLSDIESYTNYINTNSSLASTIPSLLSELNRYSASINDIISKFDGYERYLYFESSSYAWPKITSNKPFLLYPVTSSQAVTWYNTNISVAQSYDAINYNNLEYAVPVYLKDDTNNQPFLTFLNMVGHYFDNIWIYLKSITDLNLANNNLEQGISKDFVYERLKSLGLKLYNSQAGEDVNQFLIGANTGSSVWNNDTTITGSYLNNIPRKDLVAELYKRIYHNLPYLLKTKGTVTGLETLMTMFGISGTSYKSSNGEQCSFYKYTIIDSSIDTIITYSLCGGGVEIYNSIPLPGGASYDIYLWIDSSVPVTISAPANVTSTLINVGDSTILNIKEYGGGLKTSLIQGYNNDKVRIVQNTITGSVLSPLLSLQTFPTNTNDFRENDSHYIDISFSPQNQIDNYVSKSIASNNPTWSLDDYIGDPRQQYSSSYIDLDAQRKLYFETGVSGYAPFTASALDYNGFIRLVEYFDNSLFKMLEDFVPERASLSTGVTFNSPVLERNKVVYANPTATTTQSVHEAEIPVSTIGAQYGTFYNALSSSNNTMGWFDGELSGSIVDVNQYFEDNYNPYLQPTGTIDQNFFQHSDWNVLLNNVSKSVQSSYRKKVDNYNFNYALTPICYQYTITSEVSNPTTWVYKECIPGGLLKQITLPKNAERLICSAITPYCISGCSVPAPSLESECTKYNITFPAELQDSYLSLRSYSVSRYEGSKLTSLKYNTYTSASYTGSDGFTIQNGDKSYGKTAVIDRQSYKIGWVKNIPSQSLNFIDKTQIQLKYLVDKNSNITELNQSNNNIFEVQNIFKSGDNVVLSISDPIRPSFQKPLDGLKSIFRGGYSYDHILYRENNNALTFTYLENVIDPNPKYAGFKAIDSNFYAYKVTGKQIFRALLDDQNNSYPSSIPVTIDENPANVFGYSFIENYGGTTQEFGWNNGNYIGGTSMAYQSIPYSSFTSILVNGNNFPSNLSAVKFSSYPFNDHVTGYSWIYGTGGNPREETRYKFDQNPNNDLVYDFRLLKFNITSSNFGGYENDPDFDFNGLTNNGDYLFVAPRNGIYTISGKIPLLISLTYFKDLYPWVDPVYNPYPYNDTVNINKGVTLKFVAVIEKCNANASPNDETSWKYVASTRLKNKRFTVGNIDYFQEDNNINFKPGQGTDVVHRFSPTYDENWLTTTFEMEFLQDSVTASNRNKIPVTLNQNDRLRLRILLYDHDNFFKYGKNLRFEIGKPNLLTALNNFPNSRTITNILKSDVDTLPYPFIEIIDPAIPITSYITSQTISDSTLFTSDGLRTLEFSPSMSALFVTSSIFAPEAPTSNYYSPIVDSLAIKPNDLIRIKSINNPNPDYYNVITASYGATYSPSSITNIRAILRTNVNLSLYPLLNGVTTISVPNTTANDNNGNAYRNAKSVLDTFYNSNANFYIINPENTNQLFSFNIRASVLTTENFPTSPNGSIGANDYGITHYILSPTSGTPLTNVANINSFLQGSSTSYPDWKSTNGLTTGTSLQLSPVSNTVFKYKVVLDRNITTSGITNLSQNFAVLRPKPDETSVIVNYKKQQGNVSQTLLIPQDANDEIKNSIGRIYQNLNTDLSNQNI